MHLTDKAPVPLAGGCRGGSALGSSFDGDHSSPLAMVLDRLDGVRRAGRDWVARCPAHSDRSPSLAVGVSDQHAVLLHCFAGCAAIDVVHAIGLRMADLYPRPLKLASGSPARRKLALGYEARWYAALRVVLHESTIIQVAASDLVQRSGLTADDRARLNEAVERINQAWEVLRGHPVA